MSQDVEERGVEAARPIVVCRRSEFVVEAELIEKCAQPCVVVRAKTCMRTERVWNLGQRLAKMGGDKLLVRNIVRHLAKAVHVVRKRDEAGFDPVLGQDPQRMAHHARAGDLPKSSDMRQAGRPVAGLEQHLGLAGRLDARQDLARLLEWPGIGLAERSGEGNRVRGCGERLYGGTHRISFQLPRWSQNRVHFNPPWFVSEDFARFQHFDLLVTHVFTGSPWRGRNRPPVNMAFTLFAHHAAGGAVSPFDFVGRLTLTLGRNALRPDP